MIQRIILGWLLMGQAVAQVASPAAPPSKAQPLRSELAQTARAFLQMLTPAQREQATYAFDNSERFNWHFVPRERKGLPFKQMTADQRKAALVMVRTGLSEQGYGKATQIIDNENVLRVIDNRPPNDTYRDPENYSVTVFGDPSGTKPWSWRLEGHHLYLQFMAQATPAGETRVVAYTPTFFGSNPGVLAFDSSMADKRMSDPRVPELPQRGRQILKQEADRAFALLNSLDAGQRKQVVLNATAYPDILTGNRRTASLERMEGLKMADMTPDQRTLFLNLLRVYLANYHVTLANQQMAKLEKNGLDQLRFAWAGDLTPKLGEGKGWYYRIHGPTLLIEYDNTQNNANHVHTIVRDLTNDFGDDILREHYQNSHQSKP